MPQQPPEIREDLVVMPVDQFFKARSHVICPVFTGITIDAPLCEMARAGLNANSIVCDESAEKALNVSMSCGSILRSLPPKVLVLSFPHAFSGNPGETLTGPQIKTFAGDTFWKDYYRGTL